MTDINTLLQQSTALLEDMVQQLEAANNVVTLPQTENVNYLSVAYVNRMTQRLETLHNQPNNLTIVAASPTGLQQSIDYLEQLIALQAHQRQNRFELRSGGKLRQYIAMLDSSISQIETISNLPGNAQVIQTATKTLIVKQKQQLITLHSKIEGYVSKCLPQLEDMKNNVDLYLSNNTLLTKIRSIYEHTLSIKQDMAAMNIQAVQNEMIQHNHNLRLIRKEFDNHILTLNAEIQTTQDTISSIKRQQIYLYALGLFGLPGLAALAITLAIYDGKLNDLNTEIARRRYTISVFKKLDTSLEQCMTLFDSLINDLLFMKNGLDFIIERIKTITNNLQNITNSSAFIKFYLLIILQKMYELKEDIA